jgi:serine O-acetyltransferase
MSDKEARFYPAVWAKDQWPGLPVHRSVLTPLLLLARLISQFGRFVTGVEIHPGAVIGRRMSSLEAARSVAPHTAGNPYYLDINSVSPGRSAGPDPRSSQGHAEPGSCPLLRRANRVGC